MTHRQKPRPQSIRRLGPSSKRHKALLELRVAELEAQLANRRSAATPQLGALMAISIALLTSRDTAMILRMASEAALRLFPGASGALAFLADDDGEHLSLRAASGQTVEPLRFTRQSGFGHAALAPWPMLLVGPQVEEQIDDLSAQQQAVLAALVAPWPPSSALFTPLRTEDRRLGALVICGGSSAHLFLPSDIPFAQALGSLVAVALAEVIERKRAAALHRALLATRILHAETQARLSTAESQLLQSAKLAAVGELAASVAHEINNPLYAARNSLYLVDQDLPHDAPQRAFLDIAQSELARIAKIISRMRDFYRPAHDELEPVDLNRLIAETLELVQTHMRHGQIVIKSELQPDLPMLTGHPDQIRQVFLNLMINACDAMPHDGALRVCTDQIYGNGDVPDYARIIIIDNGIGILEEHRGHIFEPFYTTKANGTGLGLSISAHIVAQHGGQISAESAVGLGTTFTILLPLEKGA